MKIDTACKVIEKESKFLGISPDLLLLEVKKYGILVFSDKVVEACKIYTPARPSRAPSVLSLAASVWTVRLVPRALSRRRQLQPSASRAPPAAPGQTPPLASPARQTPSPRPTTRQPAPARSAFTTLSTVPPS